MYTNLSFTNIQYTLLSQWGITCTWATKCASTVAGVVGKETHIALEGLQSTALYQTLNRVLVGCVL